MVRYLCHLYQISMINMDEPISEIELEIKKIQEQRNYDIEMISKSYNVANNANNDYRPKKFQLM